MCLVTLDAAPRTANQRLRVREPRSLLSASSVQIGHRLSSSAWHTSSRRLPCLLDFMFSSLLRVPVRPLAHCDMPSRHNALI